MTAEFDTTLTAEAAMPIAEAKPPLRIERYASSVPEGS
jgi:hypothetical protein